VAHRRAALAEEPELADEFVAIGLTHAERAIALDSTNAKAREIRGTLRYDSWYFGPEPEPEVADALMEGAKADLRAAVLADRSLARAYNTLSLIHYLLDERADANLAAVNAYEADAYLRNARDIIWRLFQTSYDLENFNEAVRWCEEGRRRFPQDDYFVACQLWLLTTRAGSTDVDSAWGLFAELERLLPEFRREYYRREGQMLVAAAIARAGLADSARSVLVGARATPDIDPDRSLMPLETFIRAHYLGDTDEAIRIFREFMAHNPHHRDEETQDVHWWYRPLQNDPRYQELMRPTG
jgi:serine/threonine-protein kinase